MKAVAAMFAGLVGASAIAGVDATTKGTLVSCSTDDGATACSWQDDKGELMDRKTLRDRMLAESGVHHLDRAFPTRNLEEHMLYMEGKCGAMVTVS